MTKAELQARLAEIHSIPANKAGQILDTISSLADEQLRAGNEFSLPGIGKLKTKTSPARTGRNPKTGESIEIAEKTVVKFSVAKALKDAVA